MVLVDSDSKDFFLSWIVNEDDREAGRPQVLLLLGELVSNGGSSRSAFRRSSVRTPDDLSSVLIPTDVGALFLQAFNTF